MWNIIQSEKDIEVFMEAVNYFHDSCIVRANLQTGTYVDDELAMVMNTKPYAYITYQRQCERYKTFELELGMVLHLHFNFDLLMTLEIIEAYFEKKENLFYWYSDCNHPDENIWFVCQTIRWRAIE
ncbi:hypothetical protein L1281_002590 [Neisseria sp. HSC-16F19]|nr:hypothetical protein [Neisseria sp. HSC-16F19]MCP2041972.1 hypothetical protein [Neisseria sp. HSC-16F19]